MYDVCHIKTSAVNALAVRLCFVSKQVDLAQWAAYQFHRPAASRGQLQAGGGETATLPEAGFALYFRRPQSALPSMPSVSIRLVRDYGSASRTAVKTLQPVHPASPRN